MIGRKPLATVCVLSAALLFASVSALAEKEGKRKLYYRYVNKDGNRVMEQTIPPEYVKDGYEVVTLTGDVVRVVHPAISTEEARRMEREREEAARLKVWDTELKRRYSSVRDIEAAKQRKLSELNGNIAILEGNIRNLKSQIAQQHSSAAERERQGQAVPEAIVEALAGLEEELLLTEELLADRQGQYQQVSDKYDRDRDRFSVIRPNH